MLRLPKRAHAIGTLGCVVALVLCGAGTLAADERLPMEAIRLRYEAPAGCPLTDAFSAQVFVRTTHARVAADGERARTFVVRIAVSPGKADGQVTIRDLDDSVSTRKVRGRTCEEVALALALVTALAIDPTASMSPVPTELPQTPPPPPPPEDAAPEADVQGPVDAGAREVDATTPPRVVSDAAAPAPASVVPIPFAAASIAARTTLYPDVAAQGGLAFGVELDRGGLLSPEVRALFVGAFADEATTPLGRARYTYIGGRVDACPLRLRMAAVLDVRPCVALEAGQFSARGLDIGDAQRSSKLWLEVAALARARYRPGVGALFVELDTSLEIPLIRDRYIVDPPGAVIFRAPPLGVSGAIGVGWEWR